MLKKIHEQLEQDALLLSQAIQTAIDGAPLNQLATALNAVLDRYLKLKEYLREEEVERVIRVEYQYADGTIHSTPPWANADYAVTGEIPGDLLRETIRENGTRQDAGHINGTGRENMLVARADLPDGESGLAGFEAEFEEGYRYEHQRGGAAD